MSRRWAASLLMILLSSGAIYSAEEALRHMWVNAGPGFSRIHHPLDESAAHLIVDGPLYEFLARVKHRLSEGTPLSLVVDDGVTSPLPSPGRELIHQRTWFYLMPEHPPGAGEWRIIAGSIPRGGAGAVDSSGVISLGTDSLTLVLMNEGEERP